MLVNSAVAVALLASFAAAQSNTNITVNPASIPLSTRAQWCGAEENTCGTLCDGQWNTNDCDPDLLTYKCLCAANNSEPGLQYYIQTLPTFLCEQTYSDCIVLNANNQRGQAVCTENRKSCGKLNPDNYTSAAATTSSASSSATPTPTSSETSAGTAAATTSSKAGAMATMAAMRELGTGAIAAGMVAAFGLLL